MNGRLSAHQKGKGRNIPSNGTMSAPVLSNGDGLDSTRKYGLEFRPDLDMSKAEELCGIEEGEYACRSALMHQNNYRYYRWNG